MQDFALDDHSPEQTPEKRWLRDTYRPDAPQLTVRAVIAGMVIGALMCLSNLYVVLKTGWSSGVTITACIAAWALFAGLSRLFPRRVAHFGALENNAMGSVASAAGYMTGGGNMSAVPALFMLTGVRPDTWILVAWFAVIAALGVFAAIPIKRQLVNREQLAFPTGTATAETIRVLHAADQQGRAQARYLGGATLLAVVLTTLRDVKLAAISWRLPATFAPQWMLGPLPLERWTLAFEGSVLMCGIGGLMSWRTGWSLLLGSLLTFGWLAPWALQQGAIAAGIPEQVTFKAITAWTVWPGAAILVSSGLVTFGLQWRSVAQSLGGVSQYFRRTSSQSEDPLAAVEAPNWWFPAGFLALGPFLVTLAWFAFDIPLWAGLLALPLSVVMGLIAARVTGETDVTPTKALGPVTQLTYAALLPNQLVPNLMSANITGGVGLHAADLLTDLKSGYLLGARPRQQVYAQFFGVLAGAAVVVPAFYLLIPTPQSLGSAEFPAPSVLVWANVSKMLLNGLTALDPSAKVGALIGTAIGTTLAILEVKVPKKHQTFLPSPSGLGISMVLPASNCIMMFIGAAAAAWYRRCRGAQAGNRLTMPIASGFIAGESLAGIAIKMLVAFGLLAK